MMRALMLVLVLMASGASGADPVVEPGVRQAEDDLAIVARERQALSENFRMNQELRSLDVTEGEGTVPQAAVVLSAPLRNYDDVVRADQERRVRIEGFDEELKRLRDQGLALASRERELRDHLRELMELRRQ